MLPHAPSRTCHILLPSYHGPFLIWQVLESFPADKKIAVLKVVRGITGLGLKEAKEMVEAAPKVLKEGASKADCEAAQKDLEEAGATVALK